jgi:hypothetical protein
MVMKVTSEDADVLTEILEKRDRLLREKIAHSKKAAPKKDVKEQKMRLESIMEKIEVERTGEEDFSDLWW